MMRLISFHIRKKTTSNFQEIVREIEQIFLIRFTHYEPAYRKEGVLVYTGESLGIEFSLFKRDLGDGVFEYDFTGNPDYDVIAELGDYYDISEYMILKTKGYEWDIPRPK